MNKVLPVTVLLGMAVILVWSFNLLNNESVFAQVGSSTDPNAGPIPEGNYTDNNTGPIPEDNGTGTSPDNGDTTSQDMSNSDSALAPSSDPLANDTSNTPDNMTQTVAPAPTNTTTIVAPHTTGIIVSPLEQVKSGTSPKDVQCKSGFTLIIKADDGSPACVKPDVAQILTQRGW